MVRWKKETFHTGLKSGKSREYGFHGLNSQLSFQIMSTWLLVVSWIARITSIITESRSFKNKLCFKNSSVQGYAFAKDE